MNFVLLDFVRFRVRVARPKLGLCYDPPARAMIDPLTETLYVHVIYSVCIAQHCIDDSIA